MSHKIISAVYNPVMVGTAGGVLKKNVDGVPDIIRNNCYGHVFVMPEAVDLSNTSEYFN